MEKVSTMQLNESAMQIILHAGNCRNLLNEALDYAEEAKDEQLIKEKLKEAKSEITQAHKIQTNMIQSTIEDDELVTTLLFTHAQDTLMTIYTEYNMARRFINMYKKINKGA